ncbi:MAG: hypothetical protein WCT50_04250 [Patescibacteria group bacterium]
MAKPIFNETEISTFNSKLQEIQNDKLTFPDYKSKENATNCVINAYFAQAVSRICKDRMDDLLNYLLVIVGTKGGRADINVWQGFADCDNEIYTDILKECNTPLNLRYLHMFLKATLVAYRSWALTAFVKFLRGNKVSGGKAEQLEGFGYFHKDSGWNELQVKAVGAVFFDEWSIISKLFMEYDSELTDRVYEEGQKNWDIPYSAQFAATSRIVNKEFIQELISLLEKRNLAPIPTNPKKAFQPRVPKVFKPGDIIKKNTISDLPPLSIVEIKVKMRLKHGGNNVPGTVQIVLVETPIPRCYLNIWRIVEDKAYLPGNDTSTFDRDRQALEGAIYKGLWEYGVQAQKGGYKYPHDYIGLLR